MTDSLSSNIQVGTRMCGYNRSAQSTLLALALLATLLTGRARADDSFLSPQPAANSGQVRQATHSEPDRDRRPMSAQQTSSPKLPPPPSEAEKSIGRSGPLGAFFTVLGSLAVVLGLFFGIAWLMRRGLPHAGGRLPTNVVEVLGHAPLAARRQMHVLRFGDKLLLVCVSQNGVDTLAEIDDPEEIARLTALCQNSRPTPGAGTFDQVFGKLMRGTAAEQTAAGGGLAAMALRKKTASAGEAADG